MLKFPHIYLSKVYLGVQVALRHAWLMISGVCLWLGCKTSRHADNQASLEGSKGADPQAVALNSSVSLMGIWDYELKNGTSRCIEMVEKATTSPHANLMINFIPTYHFRVENPARKSATPSVQSDSGSNGDQALVKARQICVLRDESTCVFLNAETATTLREGMTKCFAKAVEKGAGLSVVPHLDDGDRLGQWRNMVIFDPFPGGDPECKEGASDYYCGFLRPLAQALHAARRQDTPTYMTTQGEMGATVFTYPGKHGQLVRLLKQIIRGGEGKIDPAADSVRTGINLNYNAIFGLVAPDSISQKGVRYLLDGSSFLGISAYSSAIRVNGIIEPWQFDKGFESVNMELQKINLNLRWFKNLELHFSEVGLGGGHDGKSPAKTSDQVLAVPWYGVHGPYAAAKDPWTTPDMRQTRFDYYCSLMQYLAKAPSRSWPIQHAFLWNLTSWDVQGIYPDSTTAEGTYADAQIGDAIAAYNLTGQAACKKSANEKAPDPKAEEPQKKGSQEIPNLPVDPADSKL